MDKYELLVDQLKDIATVLKHYADSTVGEKQEDGTYCYKQNDQVILTYDPRPAQRALKMIGKYINE